MSLNVDINKSSGIITIREIEMDTLDLDKTFNCGQAFRWKKINALPGYIAYKGFINNKLTIITYNLLKRELCAKYDGDVADIIKYFNLDLDYNKIISEIELDEYSQKAYNYSKGIRILHQDLWETIVTFIISQRNRVEKIANSVERLCETFGELDIILINNREYKGYKFPTPQEIYTKKSELYTIGLGYRAEYIDRLVQDIVEGKNNILNTSEEVDKITLDYKLQSIYGIGPKVSNCILLFAYNKYEAFPIDTWIGKVITNEFKGNLDITKFGKYAGIIQQFLFYYAKYGTV
ncbi:MAG: hypothetical protein J6A59_09220 [Lachnospiraceae bacterium]|nr:hypothetical protein [Lachnospiraceae bacterium]